MFGTLILLLVLVPILELVILLQVHHAMALQWGSGTSLLITVSTIIVTGLIGATLARQQGMRVFRDVRRDVGEGRLPGQPLLDGALVLIGAAFLMTPGYFTDLIGFSLLLPLSRAGYRKLLIQRFKRKFQSGNWNSAVFRGETPVDGGGEIIDPDGGSPIREVESREFKSH